jgi:hypothetical protein
VLIGLNSPEALKLTMPNLRATRVNPPPSDYGVVIQANGNLSTARSAFSDIIDSTSFAIGMAVLTQPTSRKIVEILVELATRSAWQSRAVVDLAVVTLADEPALSGALLP